MPIQVHLPRCRYLRRVDQTAILLAEGKGKNYSFDSSGAKESRLTAPPVAWTIFWALVKLSLVLPAKKREITDGDRPFSLAQTVYL